MSEKPDKTIVTNLNKDEMQHYGEQRKFRTYKVKAHYYFDKIWQSNLLSREEAYKCLAKQLRVTEDEAHISTMSDDMCRETIYFCQQFLNDNRRLDLDFGLVPITPFYILD